MIEAVSLRLVSAACRTRCVVPHFILTEYILKHTTLLCNPHHLQEVVKMLVDALAGVSEQDQDGLTALMNAAEIGAGEIVTYLLNKG